MNKIKQEQKRQEEEQRKQEEKRAELLKKNPDLKFLFGLEQEFILDKKETMWELTLEEKMEKELALKEANEEIRKCEANISKLMEVRKQYEDYSNSSVSIDFTKREILEKEMEKIDDKIFSFIFKKNNLKSVNDK